VKVNESKAEAEVALNGPKQASKMRMIHLGTRCIDVRKVKIKRKN